jgi:hypothetical protein
MSNRPVNTLLLAKQPDVEIGPRTDENLREVFITRKYQKLDWAVSGEVPDPFKAIEAGDFLGLFHAISFGRAHDVSEGMTPLHAAVQSGDVVMTTIATCCVNDADVCDSGGWTPLCYALFYNEIEIAKFLLAMGANAHRATIDICSLAVYTGEKDIIAAVLADAEFDEKATAELMPSSKKFARGRNATIDKIRITPEIKQMVKIYRQTMKLTG